MLKQTVPHALRSALRCLAGESVSPELADARHASRSAVTTISALRCALQYLASVSEFPIAAASTFTHVQPTLYSHRKTSIL